MNNLEFLQQINATIVNIDSKYYAYIPNIVGGYIDNGYFKGIYILLTNEYLEDNSLEEFVNDYIDEFDVAEINDNIYFSTSLKPNTDKTLEDINDENVINDTHNYKYYSLLNQITNVFSEEEINDGYKTFAKIIQYYTYVTDISLLTQIYQKVLDFYANGKTDSTSINLRLILESSSYEYTNTNKLTNCGCNSSQANLLGSDTSLSCSEAYINALQMYMIQMFADLNFYYNFFFLDNGESNAEMIDYLIKLLNEIIEKLKGYQNIGEVISSNHCKCPSQTQSDTTSIDILLNYIKVLNWIKNCEIEENTNKIKVYGKQFGELFPNMFFIE